MDITFNDAEFSTSGRAGRKKSDVAIMGVPFDLGSSETAGQRQAPLAIRMAGVWAEGMTHLQTSIDPLETIKVVDVGDIDVLPGDVIGGWNEIQDRARTIKANTHCLLSIGGDHSATAKILAGVASVGSPQITVIDFDAHSDYWRNDPGIELNHGTWVRHVVEAGIVRDVVQFGVRGWGVPNNDRSWANKNGIETHYATESRWIDSLRKAVEDADSIYLSVDMDVLDPAFAPGVAYPEPGGLTTRELFSGVQMVMSSGKVIGADVMEVIPQRDHSDITVKAGNRVVAQMLTGLACRDIGDT